MDRAQRIADREALQQEIAGQEFQDLLGQLKRRTSAYKCLETWGAVADHIHKQPTNEVRQDALLMPIVRAYANGHDRRWQTILFFVFWRKLQVIFDTHGHWDNDHEERWRNIMWAFYCAITRPSLARRPRRLAAYIYNKTMRIFYKTCERKWRRHDHLSLDRDGVPPPTAKESPPLNGRTGGGCVKALDKLVRTGLISETDRLLVVATRIYDVPLVAFAMVLGISPQAAFKRRSRAEAKLRNDPDLREFLSNWSPEDDL